MEFKENSKGIDNVPPLNYIITYGDLYEHAWIRYKSIDYEKVDCVVCKNQTDYIIDENNPQNSKSFPINFVCQECTRIYLFLRILKFITIPNKGIFECDYQ